MNYIGFDTNIARTDGGNSPNSAMKDMTKAMVAAIFSGRILYILIGGCLLLSVYTDIDVVQLVERFGAVDTTTKYNHNDCSDSSNAMSVDPIVLDHHHHATPEHTENDSSHRHHHQGRSDGTPLQNLRLVFLGDSVTRYQYLSLAYYIRYGYWYDTNIAVNVNNLMNAHSFHHPFHPHEDWNEFFLQSNRILYPMEICDCIRGSGIKSTTNTTASDLLVERRYFYDTRTNNMLVYINMNGIETSPGRGYYGRLKPETIFTPHFHTMVGIVPGMEQFHGSRSTHDDDVDTEDDTNRNNTSLYNHNIEWEYYTWDDVIRYHIGELNFDYNRTVEHQSPPPPPLSSHSSSSSSPKAYVLFNAGLHPHDFHNPITIQNVVDALLDTQLYGTWKTTTYTKVHVLQDQLMNGILTNTYHVDEQISALDIQQNDKHNVTATTLSDAAMCQALLPHTCFNVSWILQLQSPISQYYVDNLHFVEPIYRILNEEYLHQLSLLSYESASSHENDVEATRITTTTYVPWNRSQILVPP